MPTTVNDVAFAAYGYSTKNRPGQSAAPAELVRVVNRILRGCFAVAARVNPYYFGASADVAFAAPGWARPAAAESVYRIERTADKVEVVVVPFNDPLAEPSKPAVVPFGGIYRPATASAPNPQAGSLTIYYARRAAVAAAVGDAIDAAFPEQFVELPATELALYLATKDGRAEELAAVTSERNRWFALYVSFLEHETSNVRRRFGHQHRFNVATLLPLLSGVTAGDTAQ